MTKLNDLKDSTYPTLINYKNPSAPIRFRPSTPAEFKAKYPLSGKTLSEHGTEPLLQYKILKSEARLVQSVLEANGFSSTEGHNWNIIWSNGHAKPYVYEGVNAYQRINHFPNSYEVTRKDKLCENIVKMQLKFGKPAFNIVPETYLLPEEFNDFYTHFMQLKAQGMAPLWIVKPNALSRGRGIYIVI